jgi:GDP-mannose 6-dehydrogenase
MGHHVIGVDVSAGKIEILAAGRSPIVEAGLSELISEAKQCGRLQATADAREAVEKSEVSFICVGTPSLKNGKLNLDHVENVASEIGSALRQKSSFHVVVLRSTVLPGTTESLLIPTLEKSSGKTVGKEFTVYYNPEFMREGSAVADFLQPPYTIAGGTPCANMDFIKQIYGGISGQFFETSISVAEMVKYVSNMYHAVKVGFANEVGTLCKHLGVDTHAVTKIFTSDAKLNISPAYLSPGFAFGGSCLPKDLRAITYRAKQLDLRLPLLEALMPSNTEHVKRATDAIMSIGKRKIVMLGLSFKAGTDDLRESPQVLLIKQLLGEGCQVRVWDPNVSLARLAGSNRHYIEEVIPHIGSLLLPDLEEVVGWGDIVVVSSKTVSGQMLSNLLRPDQTVIDFVNLDAQQRPRKAADYQGICW